MKIKNQPQTGGMFYKLVTVFEHRLTIGRSNQKIYLSNYKV